MEAGPRAKEKDAEMSKKPSGELGSIVLRGGSNKTEHRHVVFPQTKMTIEAYMLERALREAEYQSVDMYALNAAPVQNSEDDVDFLLHTVGGDEYLDLMEIVIVPSGASGFGGGAVSYDAQTRAEEIFTKIAAKSKKYEGLKLPVHLMLYATDWRFRLVHPVREFLACLSATSSHVFKTICYFAPSDDVRGELIAVFPLPRQEIESWSPLKRQRHLIILGDPRKAKLSADGALMFPISRKPER